MIPKVDTFEHDIADEIRRKEANLAEIQAVTRSQAAEAVVNPPQQKLPWTTIALAITLVLSLIGIGGVTYYYFTDELLPNNAQEKTVTKDDVPKVFADLKNLSPTLEKGIGRYVSGVQKQEAGYSITLTNYSAVFAYVTKNENAFIDELASSLPKSVSKLATTTLENTHTSIATTSTFTASSTATSTTKTKSASQQKNTKATSTKITTTTTTPETEEKIVALTETLPASYFSDKTVDNQNMRIYTKGDAVVIYAFVNDTTLLIGTSPEGIITLRNLTVR